MADLVPERAGQLRLVVHQRHQLTRDVDITPGDREGVVHGRIEQGDGEVARRSRQARLHRDILSDAVHISGLWPFVGAAEFLEQLRSEEHTSELQSLMRISYAVFCLKKKKKS